MRKICILLAALLCLQIFPTTAQEEGEILFFDDFETEDVQRWESVGGVPSFVCEEGNYVYSVSAQDYFEKKNMSGYRNYSYSFRMKLDYRDEEGNFGNTWPTLRFRVSDNAYYNVYLYNKVGAEEIGVQKFIGTQETWLATASPKLTKDNDKWVSVKIELTGKTVCIYYNDLKKPIISFEDTEGEAPLGGSFCFIANGVAKFYLDDLKVEKTVVQPEETEKIVRADDRELIHFFDFESQSGEAIREESGNCYMDASAGVISEECSNFICRFNWRRNYYPYGEEIPEFAFGNGYTLKLESSLLSSAVILEKDSRELNRVPLCFADFDNVWTAVAFSAEGKNIAFYWNDMKTPLFTFEVDEPIEKGQISLCGGDVDNWYLASVYRFKPIEIVSSDVLNGEDGLQWKLNALSHEEKDRRATAIAAAFVGDRLCARDIQTVVLDGNPYDGTEKRKTEIIFTLPQIEEAQWYCFLWDGMTPLADVITMGEALLRESMPPKSGKVPELTLKAEAKNGKFQVSGTVSEASQSVTLMLQPLDDAEKLSYDKIITLAQIVLEQDGSFSADISAEETLPEGDYRVYAGSDDCMAVYADTEFLREKNIIDFLQKMNEAESAEAIRGLLLEETNFRYARCLELRPQLYAELAQEHLQLAVAERALEQKGNGFTEKEIGSIFAPHLAFALLKTAKDSEQIYHYLQQYADLYSLPSIYGEMSEEVCKEALNGLHKGLKENLYDAVEEVMQDVEPNVILSALYLANYKDIPQLLEKYQNELGIDLAKIQNLTATQKTLAYQGMNRQRCYDYAAFRELYRSAVESAQQPIPTRKPGGSGGGGGKTTISIDPLPTAQPTATPGSQEKPAYYDMPDGHWAKEAVEYLSEPQRAIVSGYDDGNFYPDNKITRAEFVKLVVNAFQLAAGEKGVSFSDVEPMAWYALYVLTAVQNGIVLGSDGYFKPGLEITRQDMAVMLYRTAQKKMLALKKERAVSFSDENLIAPYAQNAVKLLSESGVIGGMQDNSFQPLMTATRAQAAKMIYEMIK